MHEKEELCQRIVSIYPDIGLCGIDVDVEFDESKKVWAVHLTRNGHHLTHFLDIPEADACLEGKQCVALGLDIAQLRKNIEGQGF
ncbi:hypothetical protein [Desulfofustis glycolicus]|uniref:Uncharacterized protein n=1 Tax=Desulfofustis glycolicus DSM 9705 TaxID=1121409 RepID=A0A1M5TQ09_9BACT|nr:hypothetical protein [Desulfofustis glycolicus]MCB2216534.1 hypothetical protein [Desulfobulbaceae bacterium]SHH52789.1 hypothetical protein SAMN02745124_00848 [Desulfofustis glycolicus DSM 9705]